MGTVRIMSRRVSLQDCKRFKKVHFCEGIGLVFSITELWVGQLRWLRMPAVGLNRMVGTHPLSLWSSLPIIGVLSHIGAEWV